MTGLPRRTGQPEAFLLLLCCYVCLNRAHLFLSARPTHGGSITRTVLLVVHRNTTRDYYLSEGKNASININFAACYCVIVDIVFASHRSAHERWHGIDTSDGERYASLLAVLVLLRDKMVVPPLL